MAVYYRKDLGVPKIRLINARFKFEPRDIWIGVYWYWSHRLYLGEGSGPTIYICLVPMLPIILDFIVS